MSTTTTNSTAETMQIVQIADQMQPLMKQLPANVTGGVLAVLLARWLAEHEMVGNPAGTRQVQKHLMHQHFRLIRDLLIEAQELGSDQ